MRSGSLNNSLRFTLLALWFIPLLLLAEEGWIKVDTHSVKSALEFSDIPGDDSVTSTYTLAALEDAIASPPEKIAVFKIEIVLESGYTITRVQDDWKEIIVPSASGETQMKAIELEVVLEGWSYWDMEVFTANVWYKLKPDTVKQRI